MAPVVAGVVAFLLLAPFSGVSSSDAAGEHVECYAVLGYAVPCGGTFAAVGALLAAVLVVIGIAIGASNHRR